jgi:DNA polymerase III alpha subunit
VLNNSIYIKDESGNLVDLRDVYIDYECSKTLNFLASGEFNSQLFQTNSSQSAQYLRKFIKPLLNEKRDEVLIISRLSDITTMIRPACQHSGAVDRYYDRMIGKNTPLVIDETTEFARIIKQHCSNTYYEILYQEQIMNILKDLLDISYGKADSVRRLFEKNKNLDEVKKTYYHKWKHNHTVEQLKEFWEYLVSVSGYLFNLSHAVLYSYSTYQTAFFMANFEDKKSLFYLTSIINNYTENSDKISSVFSECNDLNIKVSLPVFNHNFTKAKAITISNTIMLPLHSIAGIGKTIASTLNSQEFTDLKSFIVYCRNHKINKTTLRILIEIDYFKQFGSKQEVKDYISSLKNEEFETREKVFIKKYKKLVVKLKKGEILNKETDTHYEVKTETVLYELDDFKIYDEDPILNQIIVQLKYFKNIFTDLRLLVPDLSENDEIILFKGDKLKKCTSKKGYKFTIIEDYKEDSLLVGNIHLTVPFDNNYYIHIAREVKYSDKGKSCNNFSGIQYMFNFE